MHPQIRKGLSAFPVVCAQGKVDRPFRHEQAPAVPAMVSPRSLYVPTASGCDAGIGDDSQAVTDVPHRGTRHVRRCTVSKRQGKHQPRCSAKKNAPHSAAFHTTSTHRTMPRGAPRGAPPPAHIFGAGGHRDGPAACAPVNANESLKMAKNRTAHIHGSLMAQPPPNARWLLRLTAAASAPNAWAARKVRPTHDQLLPVPVSYAAPRGCACTAHKNRLPGPGLHDNVRGRQSTEPARNRVCRVQRGGYVVQLQCSTLPP